MRKALLVFFVSFISFFLLTPRLVLAASTTIGLSPQSGSFSNQFTASVVIDGHGDIFNAAQATVNVSSNLTISNLELGDCNFSFLTTPGITSPSFAGVILGKSSQKCTVYTMTLTPVANGNGTISLSNASVKRYGDAVDILSSVQNGAYTLNSVSATQAIQPTIPQSQNNLYTVGLKVLSGSNTPVNNATITLNTVAGNAPSNLTSDTTGTVYFTNVKPGIYSVTAKDQGNLEAKNIINVSGSNHNLVLSIKLQPQQQQPQHNISPKPQSPLLQSNLLLIIGILVLGIIVGISIATILILLRRNKKTTINDK